MLNCGLLGEKLGHSYSPQIHAKLGEYTYRLYEKSSDELEDFIKDGEWNGLNVTIPYKKTVVQYLDRLGEMAQQTGSVNTIVKRPNGELFGDNTDVFGFIKMTEHSGIEVAGKKVIVLGSGGASTAAVTAMKTLNAIPFVISRHGADNYGNLDKHKDADIIVNTTPVGMYPNSDASPIDLTLFPKCTGVLDVIYNPSHTKLLIQAELLGIPCTNGLYMLVAQAKKSAELFMGTGIDDTRIDDIYGGMV